MIPITMPSTPTAMKGNICNMIVSNEECVTAISVTKINKSILLSNKSILLSTSNNPETILIFLKYNTYNFLSQVKITFDFLITRVIVSNPNLKAPGFLPGGWS